MVAFFSRIKNLIQSGAIGVNAFSVPKIDLQSNLSPLFSLILRCLSEIRQEQSWVNVVMVFQFNRPSFGFRYFWSCQLTPLEFFPGRVCSHPRQAIFIPCCFPGPQSSRLEAVRKNLWEHGLSEPVFKSLLAGNRLHSQSTSQSAWKILAGWNIWEGGVPLVSSLTTVLEYLSDLLSMGKAFNTAYEHKSIVSSTLPPVNRMSIGSNPQVKNWCTDAWIWIFSAHWTKGPAASAAASNGGLLDAVLKAGNWTSHSTFDNFYFRRVMDSSGIDQVLGFHIA